MRVQKKVRILLLVIAFSLITFINLDAAQGEMELFSEAENRYYSRNYSIALELYDEFLGRFPLSDLVPDVQYRRAVCMFRLGRLPESRAVFESIERRYRATKYIDYVPFWVGVILYREKDFLGSRDRLVIFLQKVRDDELVPQALLYKALSEVSLGEFFGAMHSMDRLIESVGYENLTPYQTVLYCYILLKAREYTTLIEFQDRIYYRNLPQEWKDRTLLYRAEAYWSMGETSRAEEIYKRLLDSYPAAASTALRRLYIIAQQRQDLERMEQLIVQAERTFAGDPDILMDFWLQIGIETFNRGELDLSQYFLKKIWNLRFSREVDEAVPIYLAEIAIRMGDIRYAERTLQRYREISGQDSEGVLLRLGAIYLMREQYSEAAEVFTQVIRKFPDSQKTVDARYLLVYSQYRLGVSEDALDNCNSLLEDEKGSAYRGQVLRLKVLLLKNLGNIDESQRTLREYISIYPDDRGAKLDLVKLYFSSKNYQDVVSSAGMYLESIGREDPESYLLLQYLTGLSQIALQLYPEAFSTLSFITETQSPPEKLKTTVPYAVYYRGWASYRMNDFNKSAEIFSVFIRRYPGHELYPQALFMSAWCSYTLGDFEKSGTLFARLSDAQDPYLRTKARFLRAKSLENLKKGLQAAEVFRDLYTEDPRSPFADDALFDYAGIMGELGKIEEAADGYLRVYTDYTRGNLAEESLYKRGEVYFHNEWMKEAKAAFNEYLQKYPEGKLVDAALYWEAMSAYRTGEIRSAALLWERLISTHESSPFRSDALLKTAEVYEELGEYQRALAVMGTLIAEYPKYSEEVDAKLKADRIRYLIYGLSEREAELTARISRNKGAATREGREAMIELARLYILEDNGKLERVFQMLSQVIEKDDPVTGADAQLLLGEYYYRKKEYETAGKEFFKASVLGAENKDFMAYSIYRAAQSMKQAGKTREVAELVKRLEENFPQSEWSLEGKKLLGGKQ